MLPPKRRWIMFGIAALAVASVVLGFVVAGGPGTPIEHARGMARDACSEMRKVVEGARRDAPASRVMRALDAAASSADAAAEIDPRWRSLAGGVAAVRLAFREDDPAAVRVGLSVVTAQCKGAGVPLRA